MIRFDQQWPDNMSTNPTAIITSKFKLLNPDALMYVEIYFPT